MITYKINTDYIDLWGEDATEETVLSQDKIEMIARGWEKTVDEIIDQLVPINYNVAVELMDDEIREELHSVLAPCSDARFLWEYCKRHKEKYGKPFSI